MVPLPINANQSVVPSAHDWVTCD